MTITTDWLKARGFTLLGSGAWWELRVGGVNVQVSVADQEIDVERQVNFTLPIPFTCEALEALIALLTPKPKSIFDLYLGEKWVCVLRRQESGRWLSLAYDSGSDTWTWLSVSNGPTVWMHHDDLPTTGMVAIITDPTELAKYHLE